VGSPREQLLEQGPTAAATRARAAGLGDLVAARRASRDRFLHVRFSDSGAVANEQGVLRVALKLIFTFVPAGRKGSRCGTSEL
jgi:hypothetical protein